MRATYLPSSGRDVLVVSCTGSGKTLSYLLPVLAQLLNRPRTQSSKNIASPDALVLVPTRELAEQVGLQHLGRGLEGSTDREDERNPARDLACSRADPVDCEAGGPWVGRSCVMG